MIGDNVTLWSGNHIGDYGEYIAVTRYGLEKAKEGTKGYDAINKFNGDRVVDEEKVEVQISDNVKVEVIRSTGIQGLLNTAEPKK